MKSEPYEGIAREITARAIEASVSTAEVDRPRAVPLADYLESYERILTPVWIFDTDNGRVYWANAAALTLWRADSLNELATRDMAKEMSPTVSQRLKQYQKDFQNGDSFAEVWTLYPNGEPITMRCTYTGIRLEDERMAMFCQAFEETSDTPETLRSVQALLHTTVMISLYVPDGALLYQNPAAREARGDVTGRLEAHFVDAADYEALRAALKRHGLASVVARIKTAFGPKWHEINARMSRDGVTGSPAILLSEVDVSDLKETERKAQYLAVHDMLTGLPNRNYMQREFASMLEKAERDSRHVGFLFIDLDNFKNINDSLGHAVGDKLLIEVADRLRSNTRDEDVVTRLGGDEFIVFLHDASDKDHIQFTAQRIQDVLRTAIVIGEHELQITPSIGISLFPEDGRDMDTLMKHADLAMYQAKDSGRNQHCFFTSDMRERAELRLELESSLRRAVDNGDLEVHYQPQVSLSDDTIIGAEALLRWNHPTRGLLGAGEFIGIAEETGLVEPIGEWVIAEAASQQKRWRDAGHDLSVSVNLSPRQFRSDHLIPTIERVAATQGFDPTRLDLEITESMLMGDGDRNVRALRKLNDMGFNIAVDDFGTGYSNLAYLQRYPISCLKIDRSFVSDLGKTGAVTELIISMSKLLKVKIIAEGVEDAEQLAWLKEKGCHQYQGFFFSPAVSEVDFAKYLIDPPAAEVYDLARHTKRVAG
jgi:diguanylate cyclase (GGDEF)-like protein